jgi:hypothetical protein
MIKAVSLHKAWIARTAGMFVLSALAVAFFVTPMIALGANGNANPKTLTTFKADFEGKVDGTLPPGVTIQNFKAAGTAFKLTLSPTIKFAELKKGAWLFISLTDQSNSRYGFLATVDTINPTTKQVKVLIGPPGDTSKVSATAIKLFEGNEVFLNFGKDTTGTLMNSIPEPAGTGWK